MPTKAASAVPTKTELYDLNGELSGGMFCCGLTEYEGVGQLRSVRDARNIRYAGYHVADNRGFVLATGIEGKDTKQMRFLTQAGFKKIKTFKNPRSGNTIVLFGATTLKSPLKKDKDADEDRYRDGALGYSSW